MRPAVVMDSGLAREELAPRNDTVNANLVRSKML